MWQGLKKLQETVWPKASRQDLMAELCRALLASGNWKLAKSYLTGTGSTPLPQNVAEDIVISAARDYFYSASSLDALEISMVSYIWLFLERDTTSKFYLRKLSILARRA